MLVSPAEPEMFYKLGTRSLQTERFGSDFLIASPVFGLVGVQRKAISDLVASVKDGRVERELWQMKGLGQGIWLIEGRLDWTSDGQLLSSTRLSWTKANHLGVVLSLQSHGYWILSSSSETDSIELLSSLNRWLMKERHDSLLRRPSPNTQFGNGRDKTDDLIHIMQGFPGVGYGKARAIIEGYNGLPFVLDEDRADRNGPGRLEDVVGVGPKLAGKIRGIFE